MHLQVPLRQTDCHQKAALKEACSVSLQGSREAGSGTEMWGHTAVLPRQA